MRYEEGVIQNIEDLKQWFSLNQKQGEPNPYFSIYRGPEQKPDRMVFRNESVSETDRAWSMIEDVLEMHTGNGGLFRVFITDRPKGNVGLHTIYRISGAGLQNQAGIGNMAGGGGMFGLYSNAREMVEAEVAKERKFWELEQRIESLKAEQDAKVGQMDNIIQEFLPVAKDLARAFGMKMMGAHPGAQTQMPMGHHYSDDNPDQESGTFDYERIDPALDQLSRVFPDTESAMEKLAKWAAANPDLAKNMLNQIQ